MMYNYSIPRKQFKYFNFKKYIYAIVFIFSFSSAVFSQKEKEIIPLVCVKKIDAGLYQATFSYENPTKKEVIIDENGSIIKTNNGKKVAKGLNKFKPGLNKKTFTKEFGSGDFVEWSVTTNGNTKTVVANGNSAYCEPDDSYIFPVIGNGKSYDLIGQELTAICDNVIGETPSDLIFQLKNEKVLIEIVPIADKLELVIDVLKNDLNVPDKDYLLFDPDHPLPPEDFLSGLAVIDVFMKTDVLCLLNDYPELINFARPLYPSIKHTFSDGNTGSAISQGDSTQTTNIVRESFRLIDSEGNISPVDGTGITIGVMSNSFDTQPYTSPNPSKAALDVLALDLPGEGNLNRPDPVSVLMDYPYGVASDEGRAMMHIIHDVAPGAKLAFHSASLSPRNFEVGFNALAEISDIIVDDITFITEPFFGEGRIANAIDSFTEAGGIHFTSAGNFGDQGYQSIFNPSSAKPSTNFIEQDQTKAHVFGINNDGSEDYLQKISVVPGTYMIALQWKETAASQINKFGALDDLDIYIVDDFGRLLVGSNRVNIAGDPTEVIVFRAIGNAEANILIASANGDTDVPFRYIVFESNGLVLKEYNTSGTPTISGHAMTNNSVRVGAIRYNKTEPEIFSSHGGTLSDNTVVAVDFAAPDGVDTNVTSIGSRFFSNGVPVDDTPLFPNFFGTSASAPSAAAAAALLQSALPTWYPDVSNPGKSSKTVSEIIGLFKENVKDGTASSPQAGAGMIDANKVFNSLAAQTSRITSFEFPDNDEELASTKTVKIHIIGDFFPPAPKEGEVISIKVLLDEVELIGTIINDGVIEVDIPPFSGNPVLRIYTEPKAGSYGNGGFSEPYQFFQDGKIALTVKANPADTVNEDGSVVQNPITVKYGEKYKSKLTYTVKGIPEGGFVDESGNPTTFEAIFPPVVFETTADGLDHPDVGNYPITPSFGDEVYDTDSFIVNFALGDLVVEKNNLTITPKNKETVYGEKILIELEYSGYGTINSEGSYSLDLINNPTDFLNKLKTNHINDFYKTDGITPIGLINNFEPDVDRYQQILELLEHGSWISSKNTFLNRLEKFPYRGSSYLENSGYAERVYGLDNTDIENAFINFNPLDFTAYLDYFDTDDGPIENGKVLGIINGQRLGVINGQRIGIINGKVLGIINGRVLGVINGQRIGVVNGQVIGVINGQRLGVINDSTLGGEDDTNDYNQVFSIIDSSDFSQDCLDNESCAISKFYAINLLSGIGVTNSEPQYIFPGTFLNPMSDNFNITYNKAELTIAKKELTVKTAELSIPYGGDIGAEITTEFDYTYDDLTGSVFPDGIPYYFKNADASDTQEYELGDKMNVGTYNIYIRDIADNYNIVYGDGHGQLTITETTITVDATIAENIKYGQKPIITVEISGFPYNDDADATNDEDTSTLFPEGEGEIPYFFMKKGETPDNCVDCTKYMFGGPDKMDIGEYDIFITDEDSDNYKIEYASDRGTLTVEPAILIVATTELILEYGANISEKIQTTISGFAYVDENESTIYPDGSDGAIIPYQFTHENGSVFGIDSVKELGVYKVGIGAPASSNYVLDYGLDHGDLTIVKAVLEVEITPIGSVINQGDTPKLTTIFISGNVFEEEVEDVFGPVVPYEFIDESGDKFYDTSVPGAFNIRITDPTNYIVTYVNQATLFINPFNDDIRKVRTYADCVRYNEDTFDYTVIYRYENDNNEAVFVPLGSNNEIIGTVFDGRPPTLFLPGSNTFEIRFDGAQLIWSLTTYGSTNKSSISASNQSDTGECTAKTNGVFYTLYPNPVHDDRLTIIQEEIQQEAVVYILDMFGRLLYTDYGFNGYNDTIEVDMSNGDLYPSGMYIVKIVNQDQVKTFNIIKE